MDTLQIINNLSQQIKIYDSKYIKGRFCCLISCDNCNLHHYKDHNEIEKGLKRNCKFFCSRKCHAKYHQTKLKVSCAQCSKIFLKLPSQISKTKNNFCSKSCAATFNNKNKTYGTRRSKIENLIEDMIRLELPTIIFDCNNKITIGSELDFYFPVLKLAIQINGPTHYKPIYGQEKFEQILKNDEEKRSACLKNNIKLIEMNYSEDKYLSKNKIQERLLEIKIILGRESGIRIHETQ